MCEEKERRVMLPFLLLTSFHLPIMHSLRKGERLESLTDFVPSAVPKVSTNQQLTIVHGHIIPALATIPDNHVDLIVTSPPYWGLRDYGEETVTVWDGDPECEHEWGLWHEDHDIREETISGKTRTTQRFYGDESRKFDGNHQKHTAGQFCSKCGAWRGQLGLEPSLDLYIKHLLQITAELYRVLKPTGVLFWNHGDSYSGKMGKRSGWSYRSNLNNETNEEALEKGVSLNFNADYSSPQKCMCLQNYRLLIRLVDEQGWIARNDIKWHKKNHMPSSVIDRFTNSYEPIFFLSKSNKTACYWNEKTGLMADRPPAERIEGRDWEWRRKKVPVSESGANLDDFNKEPYKNNNPHLLRLDTTEGEPFKYSFWNSFDYWFDLDAVREPFTEPLNRWGGNNVRIPKETKWIDGDEKARWQMSVRDRESRPNPSGKNPGDVWTMNTQPFPDAHFAVFPPDLPERCIKCGCPKEICTQCGKARVRIIERDVGDVEDRPYRTTIGWTTCSCTNPEYRPGIVLDPFLGSGTTMKVARKLGVSCIGIEISPKYVAMAKREVGWNEGLFGIEFHEVDVGH